MDTSTGGDKPAEGETNEQPGSDEAPMHDGGGDNITTASHQLEGGVADPDTPSDVVPAKGPTVQHEAAPAPGDNAVAKDRLNTGDEAAPTPGDDGSGESGGCGRFSGTAASGEGEAPPAGQAPQGDQHNAEEAPGARPAMRRCTASL